ncbi:MAG: vitamin B12 dependent-methionine synthase activation domain-containing protein [Candidatus Aerophobetes bacterium]|nr:vitamin B12 dependent-methionine synthase activation domain-containing protein [Candidatus Aerophobetes bacterium]
MEVLDNIPFYLEPGEVLKWLHINKENKYLNNIQELVEIANSLVKPKAIYKILYVDNKSEDTVNVGGVRFTSRILRINLDKVEKLFPYIVTIGKELEDKSTSSSNLLKQFYLDKIGDKALDSVRKYLEGYLKRKYRLGQISGMSPGSLEDWPITQQEQLFSVFGNVEELIGVKLTDSLLMIPKKSVSGIYFPTEVTFYSCQLCPREDCRERKAPYDRNLEESYKNREARVPKV